MTIFVHRLVQLDNCTRLTNTALLCVNNKVLNLKRFFPLKQHLCHSTGIQNSFTTPLVIQSDTLWLQCHHWFCNMLSLFSALVIQLLHALMQLLAIAFDFPSALVQEDLHGRSPETFMRSLTHLHSTTGFASFFLYTCDACKSVLEFA